MGPVAIGAEKLLMGIRMRVLFEEISLCSLELHADMALETLLVVVISDQIKRIS